MQVVRNKETGKFKHVAMGEDEYSAATDGMEGLCVGCGATPGGCEPDMRSAHCEACGKAAVYGFEELMLMGRVRLAS